MIGLTIVLREPAWPELLDRKDDLIHLGNDAPPIQVAGLEHGMTSGRTSVAIRLDLPDGRVVVAETSLRLFVAASRALVARYGDPQED